MLLSIIIPTLNGATTLPQCLQAIETQSFFHKTEVIVIDSGSTDGTLDILKNYPFAKLYQIPNESFNHGTTRNYGVSLAKGEFVVFTVQDAVANTPDWLEIMYAHFAKPEIAGVVGQQIVPHHPSKNPLAWFRPQSTPVPRTYLFTSPSYFFKLTPAQQRHTAGWDNVTAMYRKSVLQEIPFPTTQFAEDIAWAKAALLARKTLVFDYNARVAHYHFESPAYVYKRTLIEKFHEYKLFGLIPQKQSLFRKVLQLLYHSFRFRKEYTRKFYWLRHNILFIRAQNRAILSFTLCIAQIKPLSEALFIAKYIKTIPQGKLKNNR